MYVLTSESVRRLERFCMDKRGATEYSLMDIAGAKCAGIIAGGTADKNAAIAVMCGAGNNGGDGLVIARVLWELGFRRIFVILAAGEPKGAVPYKMYRLLMNIPVTIFDYAENPSGSLRIVETADVIVDALFGIGFKGSLRNAAADLTAQANMNRRAAKYAVDIPSGIEADKNAEPDLYFHTDRTMTMFAYKPAHVNKPAAILCGRTSVIGFGISDEDIAAFAEPYTVLTKEEAAAAVRERRYDANKGDFGKVLIAAGSRNMTGCVHLCSRAAVEIGAGLVTAAFPDAAYCAVAPGVREQTMLPLASAPAGGISASAADALIARINASDAAAFGCGIGVDEDTRELTAALLRGCEKPLVLDADALNCLSGRADLLKDAAAPIIITPHPGEMGRLTGMTPAEVNADRINTAASFAKEYGVVVVLKGADTVIAAPDGRLAVNPTGNPGMARGGSGDVLTGVIAGLIPQTDDLFTAACVGAYLHGAAGDKVAEKYGMLAATPSRVLGELYSTLRTGS